MKKVFFLLVHVVIAVYLNAQEPPRNMAIAFYNCENLYDTIDDKNINDEDFLPNSPKGYNTKIYRDKIAQLAKVLSQIGQEANEDGAAVLGLCELENDLVLNDLVRHPLLRKRNYQYVHYDSPDPRGVDVGLLFNPALFTLYMSSRITVELPLGSKSAKYSRDILWVQGKLDNDTVNFYVNHWPSRLGGEERSAPARKRAASICKQHIDSLSQYYTTMKTFVMGDFNDNPINTSIEKELGAKRSIKNLSKADLFNPWFPFYKKGNGTLAHQDAWGLFDQVIVSHAVLQRTPGCWHYSYARVFKPSYLIETTGIFKGYPKRTWSGDNYVGGYSDHFPVYIVLEKMGEVKSQK